MISVIVSSYNENNFLEFKENVFETIGVEYEIIKVYNPNIMSISEAYNIGINNAKFEILCFSHEDILFQTNQWGKTIFNHFVSNPNVGLFGVCGSKYKTKAPSAWWENKKENNIYNIIQNEEGYTKSIQEGWEENDVLEKVVCLDGVLLFSKKICDIQFNENILGFHNYDLSFCLDFIRGRWDIMAVKNISIVHKSAGKTDKSWLLSSFYFYKQYKNQLPVNISANNQEHELESWNYYIFIRKSILLRQYKIGFYFWKEMIVECRNLSYHPILLFQTFKSFFSKN